MSKKLIEIGIKLGLQTIKFCNIVITVITMTITAFIASSFTYNFTSLYVGHSAPGTTQNFMAQNSKWDYHWKQHNAGTLKVVFSGFESFWVDMGKGAKIM